MKIVADNKIPFLKGILEPYANVEYYNGYEINADRVKDADALIVRTRTKCDASLLKGSRVKFIATATIGFDHIDTDYCKSNGITWKNAPGCNSQSVMQYIASVMATLYLQRQINFEDTTMGIVGVGHVGSKVATLASVLGMKVLLNDPPRARNEGGDFFVSLEEIALKADIISFHVPLIRKGADKTFHLLNNDLLCKIKSGAVIINSSRGEVVDGEVLKRALREKKIKTAALDVWENEPDIDAELLRLVSIGTPHIAGYSIDGKANGTAMAVRAVSDFFNLGLSNWYPENIPLPPQTRLEINCAGLNKHQVMSRAILFTYDVGQDDNRLRKSIDTFEYQRNNYPVRREFNRFTIKLLNAVPEYLEMLKRLGFAVE